MWRAFASSSPGRYPRECGNPASPAIIPANAGTQRSDIQCLAEKDKALGSRIRWNDKHWREQIRISTQLKLRRYHGASTTYPFACKATR